MSHVEKKLVQDFKVWQAQNKRNGKKNVTIKKSLEEFMETRFQIKPSQTGREQPLTILDILDMMIAPDVDATVAANGVRENALACQTAEEGKNSESAYFCSDPRFTLSGNKCFLVVNAGRTYGESVRECQDMGAELVKIDSPADDEIISWLSSVEGGDTGGILLGLNKNPGSIIDGVFHPGSWVWQDGSALGSYRNWMSHQPDSSGNCVVKNHGESGGWDDVTCDGPFKLACFMAAKDRTGCTYSC